MIHGDTIYHFSLRIGLAIKKGKRFYTNLTKTRKHFPTKLARTINNQG